MDTERVVSMFGQEVLCVNERKRMKFPERTVTVLCLVERPDQSNSKGEKELASMNER